MRTLLYFRDMEGNDFRLTQGQEEIFKSIYEKDITRVAVKAVTQYGKSEVASMALIALAIERVEKILIIAPSIKQSSIIMGKVIDHLFEYPLVTAMIDYSSQALERLKHYQKEDVFNILFTDED